MTQSRCRDLRITSCLLESGMVELSVADTGTGLTDEMRERLFLPYFSTKQRGTGLGLAIAAKIIQEHQGSIRAEKNEPAGARFIVELKPASAADNEPDLPVTPPARTSSGQRRRASDYESALASIAPEPESQTRPAPATAAANDDEPATSHRQPAPST